MDIHKLLRRAEDLRAADGVGTAIARAVREALRRRPALNGLVRGSWLGHPIHPIMVTVPIGAWVSAAVLDAVPGNRAAARKLIAIGLVSAPSVAALGLADYAELDERQRRVGLAHAASNMVATALFAASYRSDSHGRARLWGLLGLTVLSAGGALGGHLSYAMGAGVHRWQSEETPELRAPETAPAGALT